MNPLIADVLEAKARQDVEIASLEQTFEHRAECQSSHEDNISCSVEVMAVKTVGCWHRSFLVCASSYEWNMNSMADPLRICSDCLKDTAECWTIRPI